MTTTTSYLKYIPSHGIPSKQSSSSTWYSVMVAHRLPRSLALLSRLQMKFFVFNFGSHPLALVLPSRTAQGTLSSENLSCGKCLSLIKIIITVPLMWSLLWLDVSSERVTCLILLTPHGPTREGKTIAHTFYRWGVCVLGEIRTLCEVAQSVSSRAKGLRLFIA